MTKAGKTSVIVGSVVIVGAASLIAYFILKPKKEKPNDNFPLKVGSKGPRVMNVNIALKLTPGNDFTQETENALMKKFGMKQVDAQTYAATEKLISKNV